MSEKDMIIIIFITYIFCIPYLAWQIASIREELRQVMKLLKEKNNEQD